MKKIFFYVFSILFVGAFAQFLQAESKIPIVHADFFAENSIVKNKEPFWIIAHVEVPHGWKIYSKGNEKSGFPTELSLDLPKNWSITEELWPEKEKGRSISNVQEKYK